MRLLPIAASVLAGIVLLGALAPAARAEAASGLAFDPGDIISDDSFYNPYSMTAEQVHEIARGRVWTGADAFERGLVDELGVLRAAVRRVKVLAGLDEDTEVRVVSYPGSSLLDLVRPRASSEPAAA